MNQERFGSNRQDSGLERIAEYLKTAATDKQIRIEGHADNMEIGPAPQIRLSFELGIVKSTCSRNRSSPR